MKLNLNSDKKFLVDNTDKIFADSEFADQSFSVTIIPLDKSTLRKIRRNCTNSKGILDELAFTTEIFQHCVIDWDIKDINNNTIPCNETTKKIVDNSYPTFSTLISAKCLNTFENDQKQLDHEVKN